MGRLLMRLPTPQSLADIEEHTLAMASHAFIISSMSGRIGTSGIGSSMFVHCFKVLTDCILLPLTAEI